MTYQRDSKVQVYRCKKHQFNSLMLFKIHVRLELSWIIKEKRKKKKEIPGRDVFFSGGLSSEHRTHEILCMVYCVYLFIF